MVPFGAATQENQRDPGAPGYRRLVTHTIYRMSRGSSVKQIACLSVMFDFVNMKNDHLKAVKGFLS